jgi:hypothetical protein
MSHHIAIRPSQRQRASQSQFHLTSFLSVSVNVAQVALKAQARGECLT